MYNNGAILSCKITKLAHHLTRQAPTQQIMQMSHDSVKRASIVNFGKFSVN